MPTWFNYEKPALQKISAAHVIEGFNLMIKLIFVTVSIPADVVKVCLQ